MANFSQTFKLITNMDFRHMWQTAKEISVIARKPTLWILCDMAWCGIRYSAGYMDYKVFAFYHLNGEQRKTYVTRGINNNLIRKLNNREYWHYFSDKVEFNRAFAPYLHREWVSFANLTPEQLETFVGRKPFVIAKPLDSCCGKGVEKIDPKQFSSVEELYHHLQAIQCGILEDCIIQHEQLSTLYPHAVNTVRVATILSSGTVSIAYAFIRIGSGGNVVDNLNSDGMAAPVNLETGIVEKPAANKKSEIFRAHPETGTAIIGFHIPYWKEILSMCREAAKKIPQMRYIGWDVAVTPDGPCLIEGNQFPGHDILQLPVHVPEKIGLLPKIRTCIW